MSFGSQVESDHRHFSPGICGEDSPFVSVIMPVFNEEAFISNSLSGVLQQDYPPDKFEVIVADGMSEDGTRELVTTLQSAHSNIRLIDNPGRIVACGLNRALASARGEIVVRLDGHCEYPGDYIRKVVQLRQRTAAVNAGGVLVPVGAGYVCQAVGAAYHSPVGLGGAALRAVSPPLASIREVDAVHGGCWRREDLLAAGGFDEEMVRNQDDELSFRLRKNGGRIIQSTSIRVRYHVRDSFPRLFLQFAQYGYWKVRVVRKHPRQASPRHFVPALFLLSGFGLALAALRFQPALWALAVLAVVYLLAIMSVSLVQTWGFKKLCPGVMTALTMMHFGYGSGFILGWLPSTGIFERTSR